MTDQERLNEAKTALHELVTGRAVRVAVDQNGERVEYAVANRSGLVAYIQELERALGLSIHSGPMQFWGR